MKPTIALIDWYGPYSEDDAAQDSFDYEDGLYLAIGKRSYERDVKLQYIGLTSSLSRRLNNAHHRLDEIKNGFSIWLGEISSPRTPGKKIKVTDRTLDLAEWVHIYFLQLPLNEKKKTNPPDKSIVVYNRWWKRDYQSRYEKRPHADWPDLIDFSDGDANTRVVWFGGKQYKVES
jgi:hypothetical protein